MKIVDDVVCRRCTSTTVHAVPQKLSLGFLIWLLVDDMTIWVGALCSSTSCASVQLWYHFYLKSLSRIVPVWLRMLNYTRRIANYFVWYQ